jgi:hypothetical protein
VFKIEVSACCTPLVSLHLSGDTANYNIYSCGRIFLSTVREIKKKKKRKRHRTFRLHTRLGISVTAEELLAFTEGPAAQSPPTSTYMQDDTVVFYEFYAHHSVHRESIPKKFLYSILLFPASRCTCFGWNMYSDLQEIIKYCTRVSSCWNFFGSGLLLPGVRRWYNFGHRKMLPVLPAFSPITQDAFCAQFIGNLNHTLIPDATFFPCFVIYYTPVRVLSTRHSRHRTRLLKKKKNKICIACFGTSIFIC